MHWLTELFIYLMFATTSQVSRWTEKVFGVDRSFSTENHTSSILLLPGQSGQWHHHPPTRDQTRHLRVTTDSFLSSQRQPIPLCSQTCLHLPTISSQLRLYLQAGTVCPKAPPAEQSPWAPTPRAPSPDSFAWPQGSYVSGLNLFLASSSSTFLPPYLGFNRYEQSSCFLVNTVDTH